MKVKLIDFVILSNVALLVANLLTPNGGVSQFYADMAGGFPIFQYILYALLATAATYGIIIHKAHGLGDLAYVSIGLVYYAIASWGFVISGNGTYITAMCYTSVVIMPWALFLQKTVGASWLHQLTVDRVVALTALVGGVELMLRGTVGSWVILNEALGLHKWELATLMLVSALVVVVTRPRGQYLYLASLPMIVYGVAVSIRLIDLNTSYAPIVLWWIYIMQVFYVAASDEDYHASTNDLDHSTNAPAV